MSTLAQDSLYYPPLVDLPGLRAHIVKFVGGSAAITQLLGAPIVLGYISTGIVEITFPAYKTYVGLIGFGFEADTPATVAGFTVNMGAYNAVTKKIRANIYKNNAGTATLADLAALQRLTLTIGTQQL